MCAEFASLDSSHQNIPFSGSNTDPNALGLTNPDSILSGTNRGTQFVGSSSLQIDSTRNLVSIKGQGSAVANTVKYGQIDTTHLGLAVNDGTNDILFAGQDNTTSPSTTYVKIAKAGFDAKTATAANLIFNSSQDTFKIVKTMPPIQVTVSGATPQYAVTTTPHGLTFLPAFLAYITLDPALAVFASGGAANIMTPAMTFGTVAGAVKIFSINTVSVDATNVYFDLQTGSGIASAAYVCTAKVYLLQETIT